MARQRSNAVRIIGGAWRGRRIHFPGAPGLRPTADRRRETLFNWLAFDLEGARCLDLFAGSGALGFEAASRGAATVVMVEASREVAAALAATRDQFGADGVQVVHAQMARYLNRAPQRFDVVFLDPPFAQPRLAEDACRRLADGGWLAPGAHIYLEVAAHADRPVIPVDWVVDREKTGGDAHALLYSAPP
jgi:16S rRNA (guanine966-N2)-methyltransferase